MKAFRVCALIPTYDNPKTICAVVAGVRSYLTDVIVVDDGSRIPVATLFQADEPHEGVSIHRRDHNGGKGAAVKDGFRLACERGYTHVLQLDADGQHSVEDIPRFLEAARRDPEALILGYPLFDDSAPKLRVWARKVTVFWAAIETLGLVLVDPLCGYRVYPLERVKSLKVSGNFMDFDPEIVVRLVFAGARVRNLETAVRYPPREEGGVSHFNVFRDTARISWMHARLVFTMLLLLIRGRYRRSA